LLLSFVHALCTFLDKLMNCKIIKKIIA